MINQDSIKATGREKKVIYVYYHPDSKEHEGWLKIGDQTGYHSGRIKDQNEADNIKAETLYITDAVDVMGKPFRDKEVHAIIDATGQYEREQKKNSKSGRYSEWYRMTKKEAIAAIEARKNLTGFNPDILKQVNLGISPREEQQRAIKQTYDYWKDSRDGAREFLWNAKPRFGKTLTSYWFAEEIAAKKVLIATNRPAISDSWYEDYRQFIQPRGIYKFGSSKSNTHTTSGGSLKGRALNILATKEALKRGESVIFFISLQDIKGKDKDNPAAFKQKNQWIFDEKWDLFIIDESHEATGTDKARALFRNLNTNFTLHLSGTPFKALADKQFKSQQIFNWTYEDEQSAKENWDPIDGENPYYELPRMNMFAYRLSNTLNATVGAGDYAFDLNEIFKTSQGKFVYEDKVLKFLDNLFGINRNNNQNARPFPFADTKIRNELRHTFWLLPSVSAVKALKKLMQDQARDVPSRRVFRDYEVIDAAAKGDGEHEGKTALEKVKSTIGEDNKPLTLKTITLSCGQLTTGVTVKPWTAVLMLYGAEGGKTSATKYLQAAFRAQNPWRYVGEDGEEILKQNCYVFDFAPDRLLLIFQDYAKSVIGGGEGAEAKVRKLLNLLTVVAEDEYGEMKELDANEVVSMPLKLMTQEIVDGKFITSNKLFNIGNIIHQPDGVREILNEMGTIKKGRVDRDKKKNPIPQPQLEYNEDGNLILNASSLGKKKYEELIQDNPNLPTDRPVTIDDLPPSDTKTQLEKRADMEQKEQEDAFRNHLRYFARAIPIILMAYGKLNGHDKTTLDNFEKYIDAETFQELVGITKHQFQDLRDKYKLFNVDVFNASITEFLNRKAELADYYENDNDSDIFDYIPPQQTNQIYTPKNVVRMIVDNLEKESPGIFKSNQNVFIDPYIKSGLFITEIVKRLYKNLEHQIPDNNQRLEHILTHQVYGFAPSKILHLISSETIFGFMRNRTEFKKTRYQVEKHFVFFENEDKLAVESQSFLRDKIDTEWEKNMRFTAVVGNPPYQQSSDGYNRQEPIYHYFYDSAEKIGEKYCLISPARFLFNAGLTPKPWNLKMLNNTHLKVQYYNPNSEEVFPGTDIKGGVAVVYYDENKNFGAIKRFLPDKNLRNIASRFDPDSHSNLPSIMFGGRSDLKFNDEFLKDYPNSKMDRLLIIQSKHPEVRELGPNEEYELKSSTLETLPYVFKNQTPDNPNEYYKILGLYKGERTWRWIEKKYMTPRYLKKNNIDKWKIFIPESNGSGIFGDSLSSPEIGTPSTSATPTFISIGAFNTEIEANNASKYVKTKFLRCLLGILKITQHNPQSNWSYIPVQDFTGESDIDWSKSVRDIDKQLYVKYRLDEAEVGFIESHVKAME